MTMPSGRENKREAMSKLPIDETILAMWQRHNSSMAVYQRITRMSKQATSLNVGMSPNIIDKYKYLDDLPTTHLGYTTSLRISWALGEFLLEDALTYQL